MNRRALFGGGAAVVAVAAAGGAYYLTATPDMAQAQTDGSADTTLDDVDTSSVQEMVLGDPDAPVTVTEYASFTCPHCRDFHNWAYDRLKAEYIDTGKVKFVYRDVYFDRYGLWASLVARCSGDTQRFFGTVKMLYEQQDDWLRGAENEAQIANNIRRIGKVAGLEEAEIDACLADEDSARTLVAWYQENANADDVTGTPTIFINGEKHSNMSYEDLKALIDAELS